MASEPRSSGAKLWEHELVHLNQVNDYLRRGWEPVPNTEPVISHALATPSSYVFLRVTGAER